MNPLQLLHGARWGCARVGACDRATRINPVEVVLVLGRALATGTEVGKVVDTEPDARTRVHDSIERRATLRSRLHDGPRNRVVRLGCDVGQSHGGLRLARRPCGADLEPSEHVPYHPGRNARQKPRRDEPRQQALVHNSDYGRSSPATCPRRRPSGPWRRSPRAPDRSPGLAPALRRTSAQGCAGRASYGRARQRLHRAGSRVSAASLRSAATDGKGQAQQVTGLDRHVRVVAWAPALAGMGRMPGRQRLGRHPNRQAAAVLPRPVMLRPVGDLVARPRGLVAARVIGLVGHRSCGERGSGPIRPPLAQP